jgi:hypothetical protein
VASDATPAQQTISRTSVAAERSIGATLR